MGYYIEDTNSHTKQQWLEAHCSAIFRDYAPDSFDTVEGNLWVCLVDNIAFKAAGICYDQDELDAFKQGNRYRNWYSIPKSALISACPHLENRIQ